MTQPFPENIPAQSDNDSLHVPSPAIEDGNSTNPEALEFAEEHVRKARGELQDPALVEVEQPADQEAMVHRVSDTLEGPQDDYFRRMQIGFAVKANLDSIEAVARGTQADRADLDITVTDSPDDMVNGLLAITGSRLLRDDLRDGDVQGNRLHKGMLNGTPVYLLETFEPTPATTDQPSARRTFSVISEPEAQTVAQKLSVADNRVRSLLGADIGLTTAPDALTRSEFVESASARLGITESDPQADTVVDATLDHEQAATAGMRFRQFGGRIALRASRLLEASADVLDAINRGTVDGYGVASAALSFLAERVETGALTKVLNSNDKPSAGNMLIADLLRDRAAQVEATYRNMTDAERRGQEIHLSNGIRALAGKLAVLGP